MTPCTLRIDSVTGLKGPVHSQPPRIGNTYNQNFRNHFCACGELYNAQEEKGTMFQCLGLATEEDGGCGEDWWHPECIMGIPRKKVNQERTEEKEQADEEESAAGPEHANESLPPGFPPEDDFETFLCYKCANVFPWIKRYAGMPGFPAKVLHQSFSDGSTAFTVPDPSLEVTLPKDTPQDGSIATVSSATSNETNPRKRKSSDIDQDAETHDDAAAKRSKEHEETRCSLDALGECIDESCSLFLAENFRSSFCRCAECYQKLRALPQLLEEEESYEPPLSNDGDQGSVGTGSLLERGEAALSNVDRVRAIGKSILCITSARS